MKKLLPALFFAVAPFMAFSQVVDGRPLDSVMIHFNSSIGPAFLGDTASFPLWQIGNTLKSFFDDTNGAKSIMTDTTNPYHVNANNWFVIKVPRLRTNTIVDFWHRYQTTRNRDGGIVEFTLDTGILSWQNIRGDCSVDSSIFFPSGIFTSNFYSGYDTLADGTPAFSGTSVGQQYSRLQFFDALPVGPPGTGCMWFGDTIFVRFRFVSDSVFDSLAGWIIDSIKIENDFYDGEVPRIASSHTLNVRPNPSYDGTFTFPELVNENDYSLILYNMLGQAILRKQYTHEINLSQFPPGPYYYNVINGKEFYAGTLILNH